MSAMNVNSQATTEATVNAPSLVTIYDDGGKTVQVPNDDLAYWLARGFSQTPNDPRSAAEELRALFPTALDAIDAFVEGVLSDGHIDPADAAVKATAEVAMREIESAWNRLLLGLERKYPMREADPVVLYERIGYANGQSYTLAELEQLEAEPAGLEFRWIPRNVDPSQVDLFLARQGWARTEGGTK